VLDSPRWTANRAVIAPSGAFETHLSAVSRGRAAQLDAVRALPADTPVVISSSGPGAAGRCRRFASRAGITIEREYLALPSARAPAYLIEADRAPVTVFLHQVLVIPPRGTVRSLSGRVLVDRLRRLRDPSRVLRAVPPGLIVIGTRT
jgi:hypothetical protein